MDLRTTCKPVKRKKVKVLVRKLLKFESFVVMSHDAAWLCTAQRRANGTVPCHHPFKTKQIWAENIMTMGMEAMIEVEGVSMGK